MIMDPMVGKIILVAAASDILLEFEDVRWSGEDGYTIDGMPWNDWLTAMTGADIPHYAREGWTE